MSGVNLTRLNRGRAIRLGVLTMTTIRLFGGDLGGEQMLVRCDLSRAEAPVQVNYCNGDGEGFVGTQYQCADARHTVDGLEAIAMELAARACEMPADEFNCDAAVT